jgi:hypothetical protein
MLPVSSLSSDKRLNDPNPLKSLKPKYNTTDVRWHIFVTTLYMMRLPNQKTAWRYSEDSIRAIRGPEA